MTIGGSLSIGLVMLVVAAVFIFGPLRKKKTLRIIGMIAALCALYLIISFVVTIVKFDS